MSVETQDEGRLPIESETGAESGYVVAVDTVRAEPEETVIVVGGGQLGPDGHIG
jgi:hypothetical protein